MTKEYDCYVYDQRGKTVIGTATLEEDETIRVFNHLQPINGVFYIRAKKAKATGRTA